MKLDLCSSTIQIVDYTEEVTGKTFKFIEKKQLPYFAKVKPARQKMKNHIVFYKTEHHQIMNHLIAHECGHIIRMFKAPEAKRVIPFTTGEHIETAKFDIIEDIHLLSKILNRNQLSQIIPFWIQGLISQLTNLIPDIQIEKWLYNDYPDLRKVQLESIKRQWQDAISASSENIKKMTPTKIYFASNLMNYVYYCFLEKSLHHAFLQPFSKKPFVKKGISLTEIVKNNLLDTCEGDISKTNEVAEFLKLGKWFAWTDFENVPNNYEDMV